MSDETLNDKRRLENARRRVSHLDAPCSNRKAILAFYDFCFSEGLGIKRVLKYVSTLSQIAKMFPKEFDKATRPDVEKLVNKIELADYSEWTKHDYRVTIKKFFRWLRNTEDEYPPEVKWLRSTVRKKRLKLPEEILTQKEVQSMIVSALTVRDKAFIAGLYESGCRISEQLNLRIKHIQSNQHGFRITVNGKTGPRCILLVASAPYLTDWLNQHPCQDDPNAYLWISADCSAEQIGHSRIRAILSVAARRAKVKKAVNPHNFRHSRATHLANYLTEAQMNAYFGWVQGSEMSATYVHLSGRDIDNAILKVNNIKTSDQEREGNKFAIKACNRCSLNNPPGHKFCNRCGTVLEEETSRKLLTINLKNSRADKVMDRLIQDREFVDMLKRKLREIAISEVSSISSSN